MLWHFIQSVSELGDMRLSSHARVTYCHLHTPKLFIEAFRPILMCTQKWARAFASILSAAAESWWTHSNLRNYHSGDTISYMYVL